VLRYFGLIIWRDFGQNAVFAVLGFEKGIYRNWLGFLPIYGTKCKKSYNFPKNFIFFGFFY